jgi:hypothetical protein
MPYFRQVAAKLRSVCPEIVEPLILSSPPTCIGAFWRAVGSAESFANFRELLTSG